MTESTDSPSEGKSIYGVGVLGFWVCRCSVVFAVCEYNLLHA